MSDTGWRLLAPSKLILVLLLGFLPWLKLSCAGEGDGGARPKLPILTQSGYQIATGGASPVMADGDDVPQKEGKDLGHPVLVQLFFGLVGCGVLAGFAISLGVLRTVLLAFCLTLGMAALGLQKYVGFPVVAGLRKDAESGRNPFGAEMTFLIEYQWAYYATWALAVAALVVALVEPLARTKPTEAEEPDEPEEQFELVEESDEADST